MRDPIWGTRRRFIQADELELRKRGALEIWFPMKQWAQSNENAGLAVHRALQEGYEVRKILPPLILQPHTHLSRTRTTHPLDIVGIHVSMTSFSSGL